MCFHTEIFVARQPYKINYLSLNERCAIVFWLQCVPTLSSVLIFDAPTPLTTYVTSVKVTTVMPPEKLLMKTLALLVNVRES